MMTRAAIAFTLFGGVVGFTIAWIAWGILTPGDYYANGSLFCIPTQIALTFIGSFLGYRKTSKRFRVATFGALLFSLVFWIFVPEGWWAKAPPRPEASASSATNEGSQPVAAPDEAGARQ